MKKTIHLLGATLLVAGASFGQEDYKAVLSVDPYLSNGYFILDDVACRHSNITDVQIDVYGTKLMSNGSVENILLEQLDVTNGSFVHWNTDLQTDLVEGTRINYHLIARDASGNVVEDHERLDPNHQNWPEACIETCVSARYSWTIAALDGGGHSVMEIRNGTTNGSYNYFYIKAVDWQVWSTSQYNSGIDWGFGDDWNIFFQVPPIQTTEFVKLQSAPSGAVGLDGYEIGFYPHPVYGIRKDKGPWRNLYAYTHDNYAQPTEICDNLMYMYNNDALVQGAMAVLDYGPLECTTMPTSGGSIVSGSGNPCVGIAVEGNLLDWVDDVLDCFGISDLTTFEGEEEGYIPGPLDPVHVVDVIMWTPEAMSTKLSVTIPSAKDPKLVPVEKTELGPGLYEFRIVLKNGQIIRRFQELTEATTMGADFASFTNVGIYPVPVKDTYFALDFDLLAPMNINLSIVNNSGEPYYSRELVFDLVGKNKHVVKMQSQWPNGIYHAIMNYPDGSTGSVSFTVGTN